MYCIQTAEDIVKLLSRPDSHIILIFWPLALVPNSKGNPLQGGDKYTWGGKICDFRLKSQFISETVRDRPIVAMKLGACSCFYALVMPPPQGDQVPALPNFGGLCIHPLSQNNQIWRGNTRGRSVYIGVSHASHSKGAKLLLSPIIIRIFLYLCLHPSKCRTTIFGMVTPMGRVMISGQTIPVFEQMRRAVCQWQLSFLFLDSVDYITTIIAEYPVETVNFPYRPTRRWYNGESVTSGLQSRASFLNPGI